MRLNITFYNYYSKSLHYITYKKKEKTKELKNERIFKKAY